MNKEWVERHRWRLSKTGWHPGYWREKRPSKGRKRVLDKKLIRFRPKRAVRDQYGHIITFR